jgi:phosphatidylglycerophosphate synthase
VRLVRTGPAIGFVAQLATLVALAASVGLNAVGWVVGVAFGLVTYAALARSLAHSRVTVLGPADRVTLARATLVGAVAALVADAVTRPAPVPTLVSLAVAALVLDAVDGWVARRTRTTSPFGARFDIEVDAFLILVLSTYVAGSTGWWWVLAIGLARYAYVAAGWRLPWLRASAPPRYWRKVVAATQGIALTVAAADVLPSTLMAIILVVSLALLAESFGGEAWWLWRHRDAHLPAGDAGADERAGVPDGVRTAAAGVCTVLAFSLVWFALVAPQEINHLTLRAFLRIPIEGLVAAVLVLGLPRRLSRIVVVVVGVALGLLSILKILDMGFLEALDRPFNPVTDWGYLGPAVGVLSDSVGRARATAAAVGAGLLLGSLLVFMTLAVRRLTRLAARRRGSSLSTIAALSVAWIFSAMFGAQLVSGAPIASTSAAALAADQVHEVRAGLADRQTFGQAFAHDPFRNSSGDNLLTGLRGKDVLVVFVESYGRVAVQDSAFSPRVDAVLDSGTKRLHAAGFASRSGFLTSPTFGGISWLAHSTLQSGLWIDNQQRYDQLVASDRLTLSDAFRRAGWRTVADVPSNRRPWPEGKSFYHYEKLYAEQNVGYHGPKFSYAAMPDQYTLATFRRRELAKPNHTPVMAEIDLVSSHTPWAPLPHLVDWSKVGDGSVFNGMPGQGDQPGAVWRDAKKVQAAYGQSIEYSLNSLVSFVQTYPDKNLVLVVLGDHQPATVVSGHGASHDVPISIIAHDPTVLKQISGWGWQAGLRPDPRAPVWPMGSFRDKFLTAYGPQPPSGN